MNADRLDHLLSAWQEQQRQGRDVPAAELCQEHPDLAPELERRIGALRQLDDLAVAGEETTSARPGESWQETTAAAPGPLPALPGGWLPLGSAAVTLPATSGLIPSFPRLTRAPALGACRGRLHGFRGRRRAADAGRPANSRQRVQPGQPMAFVKTDVT
jgi:hypothetical protein